MVQDSLQLMDASHASHFFRKQTTQQPPNPRHLDNVPRWQGDGGDRTSPPSCADHVQTESTSKTIRTLRASTMAAVCICRRVFFCAQKRSFEGKENIDGGGHGRTRTDRQRRPGDAPNPKGSIDSSHRSSPSARQYREGNGSGICLFPQHLINKERETQLAISVYCIPHWLVRSPITPCGEVIDPYFTPNTVPPRSESSGERGAHFTQCGQAHSNKPDGR